VTRLETSDVDRYGKSVGGVELDIVRAGPDQRPSRRLAIQGVPGIAFSVVEPGCKTVSHTRIDHDRLSVAYLLESAPGSRWCGKINMNAGMLVVHQPDAEHTAVNEPGTRFAVAIIDLDTLGERGELLKTPLQPFHPGDVDVVASSPQLEGTAMVLGHLAANTVESVPARLMDDLLTSVALVLATPISEPDRRLRTSTGVDSRQVVGDCIDYAESIGREPSIAEMCLISNVSGRRLRQAFQDTFCLSPKRYFRHWVLCRAHDHLLAAPPHSTSVTRIATDLGITHLGRFASQYGELHGELPSQTLHAPLNDVGVAAASG
jgi:AraC family ethanolamine operon transcriptional activator